MFEWVWLGMHVPNMRQAHHVGFRNFSVVGSHRCLVLQVREKDKERVG